MTVSITQFLNNQAPSLPDQIRVDGVPFPLTGCTVKLRMRLQSSGTLKVDSAAVITNALEGRVRYDWAAADVNAAGLYTAWWRVTLPSTFIQETPAFTVIVSDPLAVDTSDSSGVSMCAAFRAEIGPLWDSLFTIPDGRIIDWLNEGQDRMIPMVTRKLSTVRTWAAGAAQVALPSDYVRMISVAPDPNFTGTQYVPPWIEVDGALVFQDALASRAAGSMMLLYEGSYPNFVLEGQTELPRPGPETLVAFAVHRAFLRFTNDRDTYARYATQTGTNNVGPDDLERQAAVWYQHYIDGVEILKVRKVAAPASARAVYR